MKAVELISRILSLQLAGNSLVILTDRTLVHRFHGLRNVRIVNVQLVQGMSESGTVGIACSRRPSPPPRQVSSLVGENSGGEGAQAGCWRHRSRFCRETRHP